ncbi:T9SS type A sorting domain-containing protein [Hymenobacter weizhouensis]|uniref:T9SS type A sorting domain-containing protein n=1 Tax=Hymenobacter sp. YIM 151500-1 TaxID=2987689 RepID=UPI0022269599|nr:T9SS type A sorting domain-containing protein [Hymenobacter sp. YIM 151500-1]UYZ62684.1 T9SS type A sorting domain-containing protein [Hymenobacter sp. YIM 151500-1]
MKFFSTHSLWQRLATTVVVAAGLTTAVHAEGSKNLTPGTGGAGGRGTATGVNNYIGYLQHDDNNVNTGSQDNSRQFLKQGSPADQRLYIRIKASETLYYGVRRIRSDGPENTRLRLQLKYLDVNGQEQIAQTTFLETLAASTNNPNLAPNQAGRINSPEEAAVGPRYLSGGTAPAGGYSPLVYANTTAREQDFWIEFMEVNASGSEVGVTQRKSWYDCWDFTVRDATGEKLGRLYSQHWSFSAAGGNNSLASTFALYSLIPNPNFNNQSFFVKRVSYAGIQPFGVILVANSQGTTVPGNFKAKRKSQTTNSGYAEYKLFVNNPDPAIYPTTARPAQPVVTTTCANGVTTFTLNVDQAGYGVVFIDGDSNGQYDRTRDRVLEKATVIGNNAFVWDGRSDSGVSMTATKLQVTFSSGVGPVNYPIWDCEQAPDQGIAVQDVRPGNNGAADYIFWNDSLLGPDFSTPLINPIGTNTLAASHRWGAGRGDSRLVNSYAVGLLARGNAIQINYDPATACASSPPIVLPVQLVSFTAALRGREVKINWETASERNCAYFDVERSADGRTFEPVTRVDGHGTTTQRHLYSATDARPLAGLSYYRFRQVDQDGTVQLSPVAVVRNQALRAALAFPNPAPKELTLQLNEPIAGPVTLRIVDATGRVLWQQQRQLPTATQELVVPTAQLKASPFYLVQLVANGNTVQYQFTK